MLSKWDDFPIHQAPLPVCQTVGSDPGRYDRHWMALHDRALTTQVGFGLSVHPNRGLVDAAISVSAMVCSTRYSRPHPCHAIVTRSPAPFASKWSNRCGRCGCCSTTMMGYRLI